MAKHLTKATKVMTKVGSKEDSTATPANNTTALPAPFAPTQEAPSDDNLEEMKASVIIILYI